MLQCLFNVFKDWKCSVRRTRVDEDSSLAHSHEFNLLLIKNDTQLETTGVYGSKLNNTIGRHNRRHHAKTRIALGM